MLLSELISQFGLRPHGSINDHEIKAVKALDEAKSGDLSFLTNPKYRQQILNTGASAVLVEKVVPEAGVLQLVTPAAYAKLGEILSVLHPERAYHSGVHPSAYVAARASVDPTCHIGAFAVVEEGAVLARHCVIEPHCVIGAGSQLGEFVHLFPGVVLYPNCVIGDRVRIHAQSVIGGDGFGYAQVKGQHVKIPQIGRVVIGADVEIGSNVSIDRGAIKDTCVGVGTKIDNLVQIAHGVTIGEHAMIIAQCGIAGSARIGNGTILAGQVGVNGHVDIAAGVLVMGKSVVTKNIDQPGTYAGNPAVPHISYQRQLANIRSLDKLKRRIAELEKNHGS